MEFALNFLKSNTGSTARRSVVAVHPGHLAYFGHKRDYHITPEEADHLRFWTLIANAKGRYSRGSSETFLDQDLTTLKLVAAYPS